MRVDFNQNILISLLDQYPDAVGPLGHNFPKYNNWIDKSIKPTVIQLQKVASILHIPFGYFFLDELPEKKYPLPHFRTISEGEFSPSLELLDTVDTLIERQDWAREIIMDLIEEKLPFANSITVSTPVVEAAAIISSLLKLPSGWAATMPRWFDALMLLIKKTEDAGIFVVKNGVVNYNTHRKLNVEEFRGFVLHDDFAPFVFINNNDFITGKIFTLIHEIAHILVGKSASFDLRGFQPSANRIERYCDMVAAEFLVPKEQFLEHIERLGTESSQFTRIFKVSQIVILRRLLDLNKINQDEFYTRYNEYKNEERTVSSQDGGNFYHSATYRLSQRFFEVIHGQVVQNKMLYSDAFHLTGLSPKSFDTYVREYLR